MLYYKAVFMLDDTQMQDILQPVSLMIIIFIIRQVPGIQFWTILIFSLFVVKCAVFSMLGVPQSVYSSRQWKGSDGGSPKGMSAET